VRHHLAQTLPPLATLLSLALALILSACASSPDPLRSPRALTAPYNSDNGEVLWAVAPLRNEAGTTILDEPLLTDHLISAVEQVRGVRALPLDRVLNAMYRLEIRSIRSPQDAAAIAQALGVDAIVVGSVTAYEPYTPVVGVSLALFPAPNQIPTQASMDPREIRSAPTEPAANAAASLAPLGSTEPIATFSERLDAKNHQVLMDVRAFAQGRDKAPSALGWKRYVASSDLFAQFAMHHAVDGLLQQEWTRVARAQAPILPARPVATGVP
jgi:hypothetical protein